ncbi:hypothetical protein ACWDUN_00405 [Mycobacterium sp. NPDC003323]
MQTRTLVRAIGIARTFGGLSAYVWPDAFAKYGQLPEAAGNADARYVSRLFGARDIVIGLATVAGPSQRTGLWMGVAFDAFDTASNLLAGRDGKEARWVGAASTLTAGFTVGGVLVGRRWAAEDRQTAPNLN